MDAERVRSQPLRVLSNEQREFYFENGYLILESIVPDEWVERMRAVTDEWVDKSRVVTGSDAVFDLEPGHCAEAPRLRRLSSPVVVDERYWAFTSESILGDIVADLVGPDVKFHHSKLNFKWAQGGEEVRWHQDIQFWPHTNYSPLTVGTYLHDVESEQGPLGVIPGSHRGELFDEYNDKESVGRVHFGRGPRTGRSRSRDLPHRPRPARSPSTTAAPSTARSRIPRISAGRCC